jgi:hypothetical protein
MDNDGKNNALKAKADRALYIAARGTIEQIEALENDAGAALSSVMDELWGEAEHAGEYGLARKLERAYNRLTGREEG